MESLKYGIKWKNRIEHFHTTLAAFVDRQILCDVTLSSKGSSFKAHRLILSICSSYFKNILQSIPNSQHPVIFLHGASSQEIKCLLDYMYKGETIIPKHLLSHFLKLCESLTIQGLSNEDNSNSNSQSNRSMLREEPSDAPNNILSSNGSNIQGWNDKRKNKDIEATSKRLCSIQESRTDQQDSPLTTGDHIESTLDHLSENGEPTNNNVIEPNVLDASSQSMESIVFTMEDHQNPNAVSKSTSNSVIIVPDENTEIIEISDDYISKDLDQAVAENTNNSEAVAQESDSSCDVFKLVLSSDDSDESEVIVSNRNRARLRTRHSKSPERELPPPELHNMEIPSNEKMKACEQAQTPKKILQVVLHKSPLDVPSENSISESVQNNRNESVMVVEERKENATEADQTGASEATKEDQAGTKSKTSNCNTFSNLPKCFYCKICCRPVGPLVLKQHNINCCREIMDSFN